MDDILNKSFRDYNSRDVNILPMDSSAKFSLTSILGSAQTSKRNQMKLNDFCGRSQYSESETTEDDRTAMFERERLSKCSFKYSELPQYFDAGCGKVETPVATAENLPRSYGSFSDRFDLWNNSPFASLIVQQQKRTQEIRAKHSIGHKNRSLFRYSIQPASDFSNTESTATPEPKFHTSTPSEELYPSESEKLKCQNRETPSLFPSIQDRGLALRKPSDDDTLQLVLPFLGCLGEVPMSPGIQAMFPRRRRKDSHHTRRQRTTFTSEQTVKLEVEFERSEYITRPRRFELAECLGLSETQIKIWFQNRRAKDKRIEKAHVDHHMRSLSLAGVPGMAYSVPPLPTRHNFVPAPLHPIHPTASTLHTDNP